MKRKNSIFLICGLAGIFIFIVVAMILRNIKEEQPRKQVTIKTEKSKYEKGIEAYNNKEYRNALELFIKVSDADTGYEDAQIKISQMKDIIQAQEKENELRTKKIDEYKNKYNKLRKSGLHQYEIIERLQRDGFKMVKSDFEKAPDGSNGLRQYFRNTLYGVTIDIWLQSGYSLSAYYMNVEAY